jgi:hypothetical protein
MGCQDQVNTTRNETDLRALTVEIAALRADLNRVQSKASQNSSAIGDWDDDVSALWTMVRDNQSRIDEFGADGVVTEDWITSAIAAGTGSLGDLADRIDTLESTVAETNAAVTATAALSEKVSVNASGDVVFSGTNVYIQNGTASTEELNGKGNLIVGYNIPSGDESDSGSHNLLIGDAHSFAGHSGFAVGSHHRLHANNAAAVGGFGNQVGGDHGVAIGGQYNVANGSYSSAFGGGFAMASGLSSSVFGGSENTSTSSFSTIVGGRLNVASGAYATLAGGSMITAEDEASTVAGGHMFVESDSTSAMLLAELDSTVDTIVETLSELEATVADSDAGQTERIDGLETSDIVQTEALAEHRLDIDGAQAEIVSFDSALETAAADLSAVISAVDGHTSHLDGLESRVSNADTLMALVQVDERGDVVFEGTNLVLRNGAGTTEEPNGAGNLVLGYNAYDGEDRSGSHNLVIGDHHSYASTAGLVVGSHHQISGHASAIVGGVENMLSGDNSVIVGGLNNDISANMAAAVGGAHNTVTASFATAFGGYDNAATADYATAGPGRENTASGMYAAAMGGGLNVAEGDTSAVFGGYAVEAESTFSMGPVSELAAALEAEQLRVDAALDSLDSVGLETEDLQERVGTVESTTADHSSSIESLEESRTTQAVLNAGSEAGRAALGARLDAVRSDFESADETAATATALLVAQDESFLASLSDATDSIESHNDRLDESEASLTEHEGRLIDAETGIDELFDAVTLSTGDVTTVGVRLDSIEGNIGELEDHKDEANAFLSFVTVTDAGDVAFTGTNLHLRNGSDDSSVANGKGNLIIGYNGVETFAEERSGSHNLVIGDLHQYTATGGIVTGTGSMLLSDQSAIFGGESHTTTAIGSVIAGGANNQASMTGSAIIGGQFNTATGAWSSIVGGAHNLASGAKSAVFGGHTNTASAEQSVVLGGFTNRASGPHGTVLGGQENEADTPHSVAPIDALSSAVDALESFTSTLDADVAAEIATNTDRIDDLEDDAEDFTTAIGTNVDALASHAVSIASVQLATDNLDDDVASLEDADTDLWAGIDDLDTSRDDADRFLNYVEVSSSGDIVFENTNLVIRNGTGTTDGEPNAKGNIVIGYNELDDDSARSGSHNLVLGTANTYSSFGGIIAGHNNVQTGEYSSILGGTENTALGERTVIVAGQSNITNGANSAVIAGHSNDAEGTSSAAIGGLSNMAEGLYSVTLAGNANDAVGSYSAVVGGGSNEASGISAVVVSGHMNQADGNSSAIVSGKSNSTGAMTSAIVAGWLNRTGAQHAAVLSGYDNDATGDYASVGGGFKNDATHSGSWVGGAYTSSTGLYSVDE